MATSMEDVLRVNHSFFGDNQEMYLDLENMLNQTSDEALVGNLGPVPALPVEQRPLAALVPPQLPTNPTLPTPRTSNPGVVKKKGRDEAARSRRKQERKKQGLKQVRTFIHVRMWAPGLSVPLLWLGTLVGCDEQCHMGIRSQARHFVSVVY
eukprot:333996-Pelagomonas_calceolata.AAC.2